MKIAFLDTLYHFLGGVYFAIILIGTTASFVIAGTFIESYTQSHRYASLLTYGNPIFALLLWGFFINIFLSAMRRWPFQPKHVPFLITHFGLLMVISGSLAKHYFGTQGNMRIIEGSGSHHIFENGSQALYLEAYQTKKSEFYPLQYSLMGGWQPRLATIHDGLRIDLMSYAPHSTETIETWVKGDHTSLLGLESMPLIDEGTLLDIKDAIGGKVMFHPDSAVIWNLYGIHTEEYEQAMHRLVTEGARPALAIIQDHKDNTYLFSIDSAGKTWKKQFPNTLPDSIIAYDGGFKGYTVAVNDCPLDSTPPSTADLKKIKLEQLKEELSRAVNADAILSPPLQMLKEASAKTQCDFSTICIDFLTAWDETGCWIYPETTTIFPLPSSLMPIMQALDWDLIPPEERQGCAWTVELFSRLDPELKKGISPLTLLKNQGWPILPTDTDDPLTAVTKQIFSASQFTLLPFPPPKNERMNAALLSAYLRAYSIHLSTILPTHVDIPSKSPPITLETLIAPVYQTAISEIKLENNRPLIRLHARKNETHQTITLRYDPNAADLKWPILNGEYLLRFQPHFKEIPYHVRLRTARQINYPNSTQTMSFESDLIITDRRTHDTIETTISMNKVHETSDGYRFYLSGMNPSDESAAKQVQIVVNYDPTKYWLTYLGGCILALGIVLLLFYNNPQRK